MMHKIIRLAAIADIHYPKYASLLIKCIRYIDFSKIDILVLAGDIIYKGKVNYIINVKNLIRNYWKGPIIAVFGNEEYDELKNRLKKLTLKDILWLDDELQVLTLKGHELAIIGSRGSLEKPTKWQAKNIPNIMEIYKKREERIRELIIRSKNQGYFTILVLHYSPTYATLLGENQKIWQFLASRRMEKIILETKPDLVIHAHAHNSKRTKVVLNSVPIYNVSLPATNSFTIIEINPEKSSKSTL